jgi:hypothetical protein
MIHGLGRQKPEHQGPLYTPPRSVLDSLPTSIDLRTRLDAPWRAVSQGAWNTCTAFAVGAAVQYLALVRGEAFDPSEAYIYHYAEEAEKDPGDPSHNVFMHDSVGAAKDHGVCSKASFPYTEANLRLKTIDNPELAEEAGRHRPSVGWNVGKVENDKLLPDVACVKASLSEGYPVTLGIVTHTADGSTFDAGGAFRMPAPDEVKAIRTAESAGNALECHAMLIVGYDEHSGFLLRNSWGDGWGDGGYGTIPEAFVAEPALSDSMYTIRDLSPSR